MKPEELSYDLVQDALEGSAVAVVLVDRDLRITFANRVARDLFRLDQREWLGRSVLDFSPAQRRQVVERFFRRVLRHDHDQRFFVRRRGSDEQGPNLVVHLKPVHDRAGSVVGVAAWILQLSRADAVEREWLRSRRMTAFGELAGAVAHHFSNLLGGMLTSVDFALASKDPVVYRRVLEMIGTAAGRASELIRQLQVFARSERHEADLADITEVVLFFCDAIEKDLHDRGIRLELDLQPVDLYAVPRQSMLEILNRLADNARDAMPDGGMLTVSLRQTERDIVLRMRDTGVGIPTETIDRIFEPFFTTKGELAGGGGRNPGLGLAVVHGLVRDMGGTIAAIPAPRPGALFEIRLPRQKGDAEAVEGAEGGPPAGSSGGGDRGADDVETFE